MLSQASDAAAVVSCRHLWTWHHACVRVLACVRVRVPGGVRVMRGSSGAEDDSKVTRDLGVEVRVGLQRACWQTAANKLCQAAAQGQHGWQVHLLLVAQLMHASNPQM